MILGAYGPKNLFLLINTTKKLSLGPKWTTNTKDLKFQKCTFISINSIRNFQNVSSSQVGARTAKGSKITFCTPKATTLSWYIGYLFSWLSTGGCLSEKKLHFSQKLRNPNSFKYKKKWHFWGRRPQKLIFID